MTAPHFFANDVSGDRVQLAEGDARHAARALRLRPGERITISDGRGTIAEAIVEEARDGRFSAGVTSRSHAPQPRPAVRVFQAIPKKGKLDLLVQKLTEIGVASLHLFSAERSIPRWDEAKAASNVERLREIARQAAMQSRRAWLPFVAEPVSLSSLDLAGLVVALHESATVRLRDALPPEPPERVGIVVGPEGGLTEDEASSLLERGVRVVSLGPAILRTETAALAAGLLVLARYGVLG